MRDVTENFVKDNHSARECYVKFVVLFYRICNYFINVPSLRNKMQIVLFFMAPFIKVNFISRNVEGMVLRNSLKWYLKKSN